MQYLLKRTLKKNDVKYILDSIESRLIKLEIDNTEFSVALDNKVSAVIVDSYTDSNNKTLMKLNYN